MQHVVFFRFNDRSDAAEGARRLRGLEGVVPTLKAIEVGVDELGSGRSWDLCLITRFDDMAGMEAYQVHPAHQEVVGWLKPRIREAAAVDWS